MENNYFNLNQESLERYIQFQKDYQIAKYNLDNYLKFLDGYEEAKKGLDEFIKSLHNSNDLVDMLKDIPELFDCKDENKN